MRYDGWARENVVELPGMGLLVAGRNGCAAILRTLDSRAWILRFDTERQLLHVRGAKGPQPFYPLADLSLPRRPRALLMDLDGTTALTEHIWNDMIQAVSRQLMSRPDFCLSDADIPNVSGFSVEENLRYVLKHYGSGDDDGRVAEGLRLQGAKMKQFISGLAAGDEASTRLLEPAPRLRELLVWLKKRDIKVALVSSAPEIKVMAEIRCVFAKIGLGDPVEFYDAIITNGTPARSQTGVRHVGTMGDICSKPHPWPYVEALRQLDVAPHDAIGIEDSGAGILSLSAAGVAAIGVGFSSPAPGTPETLCAGSYEDLAGFTDWLMAQYG